MTNKIYSEVLIAFLATAAVVPLSAASPYNGGIALDKTEKLAKESIPLPDGKTDVLLALAMRHGSAKGHFSGKAAQAIRQQYKKNIPIFIEAVRYESLKNKPDCNRVRLTFKSTPQFENIAPSQSVDIEVCPKRH